MPLVTHLEFASKQPKLILYISTRQLATLYQTTVETLLNHLTITWEQLLDINGLAYRPQSQNDTELFIPYNKKTMAALAKTFVIEKEADSPYLMNISDSWLYMINQRHISPRPPIKSYDTDFSFMAFLPNSRVLMGFIIASIRDDHTLYIQMLEVYDAIGNPSLTRKTLLRRLQQALLDHKIPYINEIVLLVDPQDAATIASLKATGFFVKNIEPETKKHRFCLRTTCSDARLTIRDNLMNIDVQRRYFASLNETVQKEIADQLHYSLQCLPQQTKKMVETAIQTAEIYLEELRAHQNQEVDPLANAFSTKLVALLVECTSPKNYHLTTHLYPRPQATSQERDSITHLLTSGFFAKRSTCTAPEPDETAELTPLSYMIILNRIIRLMTQLQHITMKYQKFEHRMRNIYEVCIEQFQYTDRRSIETSFKRAEELLSTATGASTRLEPAQCIQIYADKLYQCVDAAFPCEPPRQDILNPHIRVMF
jgi:hypothetical protein